MHDRSLAVPVTRPPLKPGAIRIAGFHKIDPITRGHIRDVPIIGVHVPRHAIKRLEHVGNFAGVERPCPRCFRKPACRGFRTAIELVAEQVGLASLALRFQPRLGAMVDNQVATQSSGI